MYWKSKEGVDRDVFILHKLYVSLYNFAIKYRRSEQYGILRIVGQ